MRDYREAIVPGHWAILGKGPSFHRWNTSTGAFRAPFRTFGLNHVASVTVCDVYHFTDWDAFQDCRPALELRPGALILPWRPHVRFRPGRITLEERLVTDPVLRQFDTSGRLFSYNSSLARKGPHPFLPHVRVRYFSAVAAVALLLGAGIKTLYAAGVDGGAGYAPEFDTRTCLSNGRSNFDIQFAEADKMIKKAKATFYPLFPG